MELEFGSSLGANIRTVRTQKGLTIQGLAALSGVSVSSISAYERGTRSPKPETLKTLANALETPINVLLGVETKNTLGEPIKGIQPAKATDDIIGMQIMVASMDIRVSIDLSTDKYVYNWFGKRISRGDLKFIRTYLDRVYGHDEINDFNSHNLPPEDRDDY